MTIRISALYLQVLLIYRFVMQWLAFSFYRTIKMLLLKPRWLNLQLTVQSTCTFNIPIVVLALQRMKIPWRTQNDNWTGDMFSSVDREWWFRPSVNSWRWAFFVHQYFIYLSYSPVASAENTLLIHVITEILNSK